MKSSGYRLLIVIASMVFTGIIGLQMVWIWKGYQQATDAIQSKLDRALADAIEDINTVEDLTFIAKAGSGRGDSVVIQEFQFIQSQVSDSSGGNTVQSDQDIIIQSHEDGASNEKRREVRIEVSASGEDQHIEAYQWTEDSVVEEVLAMEKAGRLEEVIRKIKIENLRQTTDWQSRLDSTLFATKIAENLNRQGLDVPFAFAITTSGGDVFDRFSTSDFDPNRNGISAKSALFPNALKDKNTVARVQLHSTTGHALAQIGLLALLSLSLSLIMLLIFIYTIRKLLNQSRLSQLKTDFINNMSHELKTPLATISVATDALLHPASNSDAERKSFAQMIKAEHKRIQAHVDRVLQMAQAQSGAFELQLSDVIMNEVLAEIQHRFESAKHEPTISWKLPDAVIEARIDSLHVTSAIENLIDNALKYAQGSLIEVALVDQNDAFLVVISDNGKGIEPKDQKQIFDRFYRVQSGNIHDNKGFGLGLSYVQTIAEAHGGSITMKSNPGNGSAFTLTLPKHV